MLTIILPAFNPVALNLGFIEIRWYALAYIVGLILGTLYAYFLENDINTFKDNKTKKKFFEDALIYLGLSVIIGGRLGYIIFYNLSYYLNNPIKIFYIWEGGMSFHGALIACIITIFIFAKTRKYNIFTLGDLAACGVPIGIFFGRIANFINQELPGRITTMPWGVIFNNDIISRHPSELYEALSEGLLLFIILLYAWKKLKLFKYPGLISALFLFFYGLFRVIIEFYREPDPQIGYLMSYFTLGQLFSFLMVLIGLCMYLYLKISLYGYKKNL